MDLLSFYGGDDEETTVDESLTLKQENHHVSVQQATTTTTQQQVTTGDKAKSKKSQPPMEQSRIQILNQAFVQRICYTTNGAKQMEVHSCSEDILGKQNHIHISMVQQWQFWIPEDKPLYCSVCETQYWGPNIPHIDHYDYNSGKFCVSKNNCSIGCVKRFIMDRNSNVKHLEVVWTDLWLKKVLHGDMVYVEPSVPILCLQKYGGTMKSVEYSNRKNGKEPWWEQGRKQEEGQSEQQPKSHTIVEFPFIQHYVVNKL